MCSRQLADTDAVLIFPHIPLGRVLWSGDAWATGAAEEARGSGDTEECGRGPCTPVGSVSATARTGGGCHGVPSQVAAATFAAILVQVRAGTEGDYLFHRAGDDLRLTVMT